MRGWTGRAAGADERMCDRENESAMGRGGALIFTVAHTLISLGYAQAAGPATCLSLTRVSGSSLRALPSAPSAGDLRDKQMPRERVPFDDWGRA
jgi:hypothetical protein